MTVLSEDDMRKNLHEQLLELGFTTLISTISPSPRKPADQIYIYSCEGLPAKNAPTSRGLWQTFQRTLTAMRDFDIMGSNRFERDSKGVGICIRVKNGQSFAEGQVDIISTLRRGWPMSTPNLHTEYGTLYGYKAPPKPPGFNDFEMVTLATFTVGDLFEGRVDIAELLSAPSPAITAAPETKQLPAPAP